VPTHLALAERIHFPVSAHVSALVIRHHLFPPSVLLRATLPNLSSDICVLMELDPSTMTRSSTCCLGCDAAVLPAGAVCIGAGADGLVIEEIASDRGLFLSKLERKLRGGAHRVMRTLLAYAVIVKSRAGYGQMTRVVSEPPRMAHYD
jgi:hypothetical protein